MASALIELKDESGEYKYSPEQVYNYLDNVRKMGNVQTFCNKDFYEMDKRDCGNFDSNSNSKNNKLKL